MKRIQNRSDKRKKQEEEYKQLKEDKKQYMVENKFYRCFHCNTRLDEEDETVQWHHLTGRNGDLLTEWRNVVPTHPNCHYQYHHVSITELVKGPWYNHYLERLKQGAQKSKYFAQTYNQELRKMEKAGLIDLEQQLKMTVDENI